MYHNLKTPRVCRKSAIEKHIFAQESGYVSVCDCGLVGKAALAAGAGRRKKKAILITAQGYT